MFKLYRCKICGDPYLGDDAPSKCPFCGAKKGHFVDAKDYVNEFKKDHNFSDTEKENFKAALDIEIGNASFYLNASKKSSDDFHQGMFKALHKVESEHASIFSKHLGINKPPMDDTIEASQDGHTNLLESHRREEIAIKAYQKFANEATTPRAKEVFEALIAIESDHLGLQD